jgi:hypothetical protein
MDFISLFFIIGVLQKFGQNAINDFEYFFSLNIAFRQAAEEQSLFQEIPSQVS